MKRVFSLTLALCLGLSLAARAEGQALNFYMYMPKDNDGFKRFAAAHSDVKLQPWETYYETTGDFLGALLTGSLESDILVIKTNSKDSRQIMDKGYFLDLSGSEVIREAVGRMHPSIAGQVMADGKIYAIPESLAFDYLQINQRGWTEAGLDGVDAPDSFPAFLDFLEQWCAQAEASGVRNIRIKLEWDFDLYNQSSYTAWLARELINSYILQKQYAGESLSFDEPDLNALLERCKTVGRRLYDIEPTLGDGEMDGRYYALFETGLQTDWPQMSQTLNFRLNPAQPKLMKAWMDMTAINARSELPGLALEMLEEVIRGPENFMGWRRALLYRDAEPVADPYYEEELTHWATRVQMFREKLAQPDLPLDERGEAEKQLAYAEYALADMQTEKRMYYVSPRQLAEYKQYADYLYFPPPDIFNTTTDSSNTMRKLQEQFASGLLSTDQLLGELARIARIIEMENR